MLNVIILLNGNFACCLFEEEKTNLILFWKKVKQFLLINVVHVPMKIISAIIVMNQIQMDIVVCFLCRLLNTIVFFLLKFKIKTL